MWPFRNKGEFPELEERLEKLERANRDLRVEWEDTYERIVRALRRITKRAEVVERAERQAEVETNAGEVTGEPRLTPAQEALQAQVLARRQSRGLRVREG